MTRRSYVRDVWLPESRSFLILACLTIAGVTAPDVPGTAAQVLAYLGAAVLWAAFLIALRALTWTPWAEEPVKGSPFADNVVPLRPGPGDAG